MAMNGADLEWLSVCLSVSLFQIGPFGTFKQKKSERDRETQRETETQRDRERQRETQRDRECFLLCVRRGMGASPPPHMARNHDTTSDPRSGGAPNLTPLEEFHRRRILATVAIVCAMLMQSFILGASVVVGDLALVQFEPQPGSYAWNGVFAVALSFTSAYILSIEVVRPLIRWRPKLRTPVSVVCVLLSPAGYAVAGAAVSAHSIALLYVAWVGILGCSYSFYDMWTRG